jgi:hypothetical protein
MQNRKYLFAIIFATLTLPSLAQTSYVPLWAKENWFLQRLEIKAATNSDLNLSTVKPYMRKANVEVADSFRTMLLAGQNPANLTKMDEYNLNRFQANNKEYSQYTAEDFPDWNVKKPWGKYFFPTKGNLLEVNTKDFYLAVNPVFGGQLAKESDYDEKLFVNSKGATFRGLIAKKVSFDFFVADNQERGPQQFREFFGANEAVPGAGYYKRFKDKTADFFMTREGKLVYGGAADYLDARGSIGANVTKYINLQFGYDKNFIGNGYRSMFLSDFSSNSLFFKINTRIWKLNYTNLYMELIPNYIKGGDKLLDKKYATMHHLGINVNKWLNVGLFESVIFGRPNRYDFGYLLPVIFLRSIEQQNGSPDNANVGLDLKANIAKKVQVYGQLMLDELNIAKLRKDRTWWANKTGTQLGLKYVDVAGIDNLDLQVEWNRVRPYTYSHYDSVASYMHYNQPLAHPLGANFQEFIGILRYQPISKLYITAKVIGYKQGVDTVGSNFGSNPKKLYGTRSPVMLDGVMQNENGYNLVNGVQANCLYGSVLASYELFENLFIEASGVYRSYKLDGVKKNTSTFGIGLRWNMFRREYDY